MTESDLIKILRTAGNVRDEYDQDYERIIRLRSLMGKVTTSYGPIGHGSSIDDKLSAQYSTLEELQEHCTDRQEAYINALKNSMDIIELANSTEQRRVLKLRYVDGKRWDEIASIINYSNMQCHRFHDAGLKAILEKI